ncbi:hypothetical protein MHPYR_470055 [uncultured Mycobacterium sp.]|uniref:Uncharacterized protein n=1 Tax=uncultured Mycobacterium sp. TaxID=171292 RepID=A0A1Y5PNJ6_9MYCO|nr:hypothetical protein MHPYR_470055 [uncultured Mycobacterium sp.]
MADACHSERADDRIVPSGRRGDRCGVGDIAADDVSARVNGSVRPPNESGDLVALVECVFDEVDTGTAGCSEDKKLHNICFL